jgi:cytochrome c biogenesis protein CcmG, thiol:disulfide interchange protein DsbE
MRACSATNDKQQSRICWFYLVPIAVLFGLMAVFYSLLERDPEILPSVLIGRPVPSFSLEPVEGRTLGLASGDLRGAPSLVNVFASWCVPCRTEHPLLMDVRAKDLLPVHGINYKDRPQDVAKWLSELGDPYTRTGADLDGRVSIDWGVYGIPETFVISADGKILYKHVGPLTEEAINKSILPLVLTPEQRISSVNLKGRKVNR